MNFCKEFKVKRGQKTGFYAQPESSIFTTFQNSFKTFNYFLVHIQNQSQVPSTILAPNRSCSKEMYRCIRGGKITKMHKLRKVLKIQATYGFETHRIACTCIYKNFSSINLMKNSIQKTISYPRGNFVANQVPPFLKYILIIRDRRLN